MEERKIALLRAHERNIERYRGLLRTKLNDIETSFVERRLSEERFAIEILKFTGREVGSVKPLDLGARVRVLLEVVRNVPAYAITGLPVVRRSGTSSERG
ncbi:hypothetical protein [Bradyrhizobium sp. BRP56]|uniref:hypothetical protein n=1 Tax=Bradyrhizobium sp. BRP56 TaxID=2793819 RepID=UPI001CD5300B|nr:hypothetical protein [Bradyrhizobium sp. BRP56]MCA1401141.1 hypothetical protein [Bradyrhizobium sp. BRP56]